MNYMQSFADVPLTEHGVATEPFLEASDGLLQMFGEDIPARLMTSGRLDAHQQGRSAI